MAITYETNGVLWNTGDATDVIAALGSEVSDNYTFSATCVQADIQLKATNSGTPLTGDTIDFYARLVGNLGTDNTGDFLTTIDTFEDAGSTAIWIKSMKFYPLPGDVYQFKAESNVAATRTITVAIAIKEMLVA